MSSFFKEELVPKQTVRLKTPTPYVLVADAPALLLVLLVFTDCFLVTVEEDVQKGFSQENRTFGSARYGPATHRSSFSGGVWSVSQLPLATTPWRRPRHLLLSHFSG